MHRQSENDIKHATELPVANFNLSTLRQIWAKYQQKYATPFMENLKI